MEKPQKAVPAPFGWKKPVGKKPKECPGELRMDSEKVKLEKDAGTSKLDKV